MTSLLKITMTFLVLTLPVLAQEFRFISFDVSSCSITSPVAVNARGQIVGLCDDAHAFLLDLNTHQSQIFDHPGATFTSANGINARGEIVGRWDDVNGISHGYFRSANGDFQLLDPPSNSGCVVSTLPTAPHGINDVDDIVGRCFDPSGNEHGFVRWRDGTFELIDFPGSTSSDAWAISNTNVIGGDYTDAAGLFVHGFTWTRSVGFQTVDFPGALNSAVRSVADNGAVSGIYNVCGFILHGFVAPNVTVDFPGSIFTGTLVINNGGFIVGDYVDASGSEHGFVAIK
jgi:uncharacterized membrane protein